jgi:hypothetical protein
MSFGVRLSTRAKVLLLAPLVSDDLGLNGTARFGRRIEEKNALALYELRTYSLYVGKLAEARELYRSECWQGRSVVPTGTRMAHQCDINATEVCTSGLMAANPIGYAAKLTGRSSRGGLLPKRRAIKDV